ncbi:MAG TPA: alpha/beta fold hydrolase [Bacilli bacterium]|nr:alpha/beta fold hydrolase [Bacilli bacterium]
MTHSQIQAEERVLASVPCTCFQPPAGDATRPRASLVLLHGWGGSKENYRFFATMLAKWGYLVVVPEVPHHGERGRLPDYFSPEGYRNYWPTVLQGVEEIGKLTTALVDEGLAEPGRIGIIGHSMGGQIATSAFARDPQLHSLVAINTGGDWETFEQWVRSSNRAPAATEEELAPLRAYDPMRHPQEIAPRPLLFLHGGDDTFMPLAIQQGFHDALVPHYEQAAARHHLRFEQIGRLNHHITLSMLEELIGWLDTYL